ncbi:MAG TPA: ABC transporter substrate-binding protein [Solirubrobacterales bacterium]|nr:ABC transporter substrate-binding protein [Solirubrobacterales bacterium]
MRNLQHMEVTLDGYRGPENAGILMADKRGYFAEAGLSVKIYPPETPLRPVRYVAEKVIDLAVSHQPQVVLAEEKGVPIVAVGSLMPEPTMGMMWSAGSGIHDIADLKGKTIAIPGLSFEEKFLRAVLARAGLTLADVKVKTVYYDLVPALVKGRADAIFGGSSNVEGVELEERGLDPVIASVQSLGIPSYDELVLIARSDRLAEDPESIRRFLSAVRRGTAAAIEDPPAVSRAIANGYEPVTREMEAQVEATLPLLSRDGYLDPDQAKGLVDWMQEEGMVQQAPSAAQLFTNDYLKPES